MGSAPQHSLSVSLPVTSCVHRGDYPCPFCLESLRSRLFSTHIAFICHLDTLMLIPCSVYRWHCSRPQFPATSQCLLFPIWVGVFFLVHPPMKSLYILLLLTPAPSSDRLLDSIHFLATALRLQPGVILRPPMGTWHEHTALQKCLSSLLNYSNHWMTIYTLIFLVTLYNNTIREH